MPQLIHLNNENCYTIFSCNYIYNRQKRLFMTSVIKQATNKFIFSHFFSLKISSFNHKMKIKHAFFLISISERCRGGTASLLIRLMAQVFFTLDIQYVYLISHLHVTVLFHIQYLIHIPLFLYNKVAKGLDLSLKKMMSCTSL